MRNRWLGFLLPVLPSIDGSLSARAGPAPSVSVMPPLATTFAHAIPVTATAGSPGPASQTPPPPRSASAAARQKQGHPPTRTALLCYCSGVPFAQPCSTDSDCSPSSSLKCLQTATITDADGANPFLCLCEHFLASFLRSALGCRLILVDPFGTGPVNSTAPSGLNPVRQAYVPSQDLCFVPTAVNLVIQSCEP